MQYFALMNSGKLVGLGRCDSFDDAENAAEEIGNDTGEGAVWIADAETAKQWQGVLNNSAL